MKHFSLIIASLIRLTQKEVKFEWDDQYDQNFQELKNHLIFAPILTFLTIGAGYVILVMLRDKVSVMF